MKPAVVAGHLDFPKTFVRDDGTVWSAARNWRNGALRQRAVGLNSEGYPGLVLKEDGQSKSITLHRLVALVFLGPPPFEGAEVRHLDGTGRHGFRANNAASNLAWGTTEENSADKIAHGTHLFGEAHGRASITESKAREVKKLLSEGLGPTEVSQKLGVKRNIVQKIKDGTRWGHLR